MTCRRARHLEVRINCCVGHLRISECLNVGADRGDIAAYDRSGQGGVPIHKCIVERRGQQRAEDR